jgi:hypothetical protein
VISIADDQVIVKGHINACSGNSYLDCYGFILSGRDDLSGRMIMLCGVKIYVQRCNFG